MKFNNVSGIQEIYMIIDVSIICYFIQNKMLFTYSLLQIHKIVYMYRSHDLILCSDLIMGGVRDGKHKTS